MASAPERAILECLLLAPERMDLVETYGLFENLRTLRPQVMQLLLEGCSSVKVRRLWRWRKNERSLVDGRRPTRAILPIHDGTKEESLAFCECLEIFGRHACGTNEATERPSGEFLVIGNGESRDVAILHQDDMASTLAIDRPASLSENPHRVRSAQDAARGSIPSAG